MKIRQGFVSNSSTTSFCIYGAEVNQSIQDKGIKTFLHDKYGQDGEIYVGVQWCDIDDDETGREFKDRITRELLRIYGNNIQDIIGTIEVAYRDG